MDLQNLDFKTTYPLLSKVNSPSDLKALSEKEIKPLCEEIRNYLIEQISENGGHLASNLGVVELTLAIHRVFNSPEDHIIFDVGHQCYVHKLLTGRRDAFSTIRQNGGISGFPKRSESEYDAFGTGHSSTSLSAALGFAEADQITHSNSYTVCVLGDGAYTGGMIHEALNNCKSDLRLIIILNENEMSISKNNGRFAKSLSKLRASRGYIKTKNFFGRFFRMIPLIGKWIFRRLLRIKRGMKAAVYGSNTFEDLGLFYMGPADGNNEQVVERLLREAKDSGSSSIVHLKTQKGKGYTPAEQTPDRFHGMSPATAQNKEGISFSKTMGTHLSQMADADQKICAITAAMADGTGLEAFAKAHSRRFFDVGIAEEHAVTFAAGLAANGMKPAVAIYSTFLQRAYDNLIHDVSLQNLPVVFFVDRAGLNASDGPTHAGVFDVAFLSQVPHLRIYTPITLSALQECMDEAFASGSAAAIRYPNGKEDAEVVRRFYADPAPVADHIRADENMGNNPDLVIVTHGRIVSQAILAQNMLIESGISTGILLMEQIAPYDQATERLLQRLPEKPCRIILLEEEIKAGGFGMQLLAALRENPAFAGNPVFSIALEDAFVTPKEGETIWDAAKLSAPFLAKRIREWIAQK